MAKQPCWPAICEEGWACCPVGCGMRRVAMILDFQPEICLGPHLSTTREELKKRETAAPSCRVMFGLEAFGSVGCLNAATHVNSRRRLFVPTNSTVHHCPVCSCVPDCRA
jgi:hypothetical protein